MHLVLKGHRLGLIKECEVFDEQQHCLTGLFPVPLQSQPSGRSTSSAVCS